MSTEIENTVNFNCLAFWKANFYISLKLTSLERIKEYCSLDKEPIDDGKIKPNKDWPQKGEITFKNVSFRYADNLPNVLKDLSFEIKPGEKVAN